MRTCPECNEKITVGRSDKKFCSDACRNAYNNRKVENESSIEMKTISIILKRNRKILAKVISQPTKQLRKEKLMQQGFNFCYFTSIEKNKGSDYYFCFEYGYSPLANGKVKLLKL